MKIIDAKGRLFGLINIIDLGIIVVLVVFGYISFNLARNAKLGYPIEIEAKVLFPSIPLEIVKKLQPGDVEDNKYGSSKLIRFETREKDTDKSVDIHAWLKLSVRVKNVPVGNRGEKVRGFFLRGKELNIYDPIIFITPNYSIRGTISNIDGIDREIEVILDSTLPPEGLKNVKVGDKIILYKHFVGEVIAKEYIPDGRVKLKIHIKMGEIDSLKIGGHFQFETDEYYVHGTVVKSIPWAKD